MAPHHMHKDTTMDGDKLAERLVEALTTKQLTNLLGRLLDRMSEPGRGELCDELDEDSATVLRGLLAPRSAGRGGPAEAPSGAKFAEEFHGVTGDLQALVLEVGDEEGEYVYQEHDWEPPDFDACRLAGDIERCAERLFPLLDRAAELGLEDETFFADLFEEFSGAIASYPEWIYTEEGVSLERTATECVLRWLDLHSDAEAELLAQLLGFLERPVSVHLDDSAIHQYLLSSLPASRRSRLYDAVRRRRASDDAFRRSADTPRTLWHGVWFELAGEFDTKVQTEIAESSVSGDWTKGVSLVDAAVAEGDSARALEYCRKTVDSFFRIQGWQKRNTGFDPATTPLFGHPGIPAEWTVISRIIGLWARLAREEGDGNLAGLLAIQKALFDAPDDWTAVRRAFSEGGSAGAGTLFEAWKERTLGQQRTTYLFGGPESGPDSGWVEWLIDAGFSDRFEAFGERAIIWLREKVQPEQLPLNVFMRHSVPAWPGQTSLLADLLAIQDKSPEYPVLREVVMEHCSLNGCPSRLAWLRETDVEALTGHAVSFVRRNAARLIPSPETMGGDYSLAAGWLAACREIEPDVARRTLDHWRTQYKRRRNLWRDLRNRNFDV